LTTEQSTNRLPDLSNSDRLHGARLGFMVGRPVDLMIYASKSVGEIVG
jgi:hypothetical protein